MATIGKEQVAGPEEDRKLGKVGLRGLVLHAGDPETGEFRYYPDNEKESWRQRRTQREPFIESRGIDVRQLDMLEEMKVPVAVLNGNGRTFFLNLDGFHGLGYEDTVAAADRRVLIPEGDAVLIREFGSYYAVATSELRKLDRKDAGEAKIVVRRGAVTAAIPNNGLPLGTNCVLINLTQLVPGVGGAEAAAAQASQARQTS